MELEFLRGRGWTSLGREEEVGRNRDFQGLFLGSSISMGGDFAQFFYIYGNLTLKIIGFFFQTKIKKLYFPGFPGKLTSL